MGRTGKIVLGTLLGLLALIVTAGVVVFVAYVALVAMLVHTVNHADDDSRMSAATDALACPRGKISINGDLARGCGKQCSLEVYGSSATWFSSYVCRLPVVTPAASASSAE